jgi:PleD family two-component response regulator
MADYDPRSPSSIEELMQQADSRMYEQKLSKIDRPRVLVADSDALSRAHSELVLADHYDVLTAHDGTEAVRRATLERPDLVLLESNLSDGSGIDVAVRLRKTPATTLIPIVMVGSAEDGVNEIESLRAGVDDYVLKPLDPETLRVRMDNLLRRTVRR